MNSVLSLKTHRGQREARLRRTLALYHADPRRARLALRLWEALELVDGDRGALLWVDEYGPDMVHPHCVVDLGSDRPRRNFSMEPLRRAWEDGIPGLLDEPDVAADRAQILPDGTRSLSAVAMGSDGIKAWFLMVDATNPRDPISEEVAESLMFVAGECASIVLHPESGTDPVLPSDDDRTARFAGWPVLRDIDGHEADEDRGRTVTARFLLARVLLTLVDDDFVVDHEAFERQVDAVRRELRDLRGSSGEIDDWLEVLDALQRGEPGPGLVSAVLRVAEEAERRRHLHGAREFDLIGYELAAASGDLDHAAEAARFMGRVNRHLGEWDESERWFEVGRRVARSAGLKRPEALTLVGLGNTVRVRGNLPQARKIYTKVLAIGDELGDGDIRGRARQNLMLVEKHAGETDAALRHGWEAVQAYGSTDGRLLSIADLGDVFLRSNELDCAEAAFEIVAARIEMVEPRVLALDALSHISALRGDRREFERRAGRVDTPTLQDLGVEGRAQILHHRGKSFTALGDMEAAADWFARASQFAEEHGVNRIYFEAERAREEIKRDQGRKLLESELPEPTSETVSELREPLQEMRSALV